MKTIIKYFYLPFFIGITFILSTSAILPAKEDAIKNAYLKAGLTERQAAAHLLSKFTFGIKPGDIDKAVAMSLNRWFTEQLDGKLKDDNLNDRLGYYDALNLSNAQVAEQYPKGAKVLRMAIADGFINKDSVNKGDKQEYRKKIGEYMRTKGIKPQQDLYKQFVSHKILAATYSNNQMHEVLTDFWFNHFNVSLTKNDCAMYIPAYERDAIRPNVTGKFENLLVATTKSPAMLFYLDNFNSSAGTTETENTMMQVMEKRAGDDKNKQAALQKLKNAKKNQGINENYAREVMELHTLGVDGGYTQNDVTQAAKILTGWTIYPFDEGGPGGAMKKQIEKVGKDKLEERGFVFEGDFMFAMNRHDQEPKTFLGVKFDANGGYAEGGKLLNMLAKNPATAQFIATKLATRFVMDSPPKALIDKMAKTFLDKDGEIKAVLTTMVTAPEFWSKQALTEKTKSPFELAISTVRSLNAEVTEPLQLNNWITKMGQKVYYYQAPTGFPDKGQYWINTGSLLNRMNFGLALAAQKISGVKIDLAALNNNKEPESSEAALETYSKIMMPERDLSASIKRLTPLLTAPNLIEKVDMAANNAPVAMKTTEDENMMGTSAMAPKNKPAPKQNTTSNSKNFGNNTLLAQVVGVIIGSPEFQKR
jgi:uncharacterized protein (DUF1800 family)